METLLIMGGNSMAEQSIIITDTNTEIPLWFAKKYDIPYIRMPYTIEDTEYAYDLGENTDFKSFYSKVRSGIMPITSTLPPAFYTEYFKQYLKTGRNIIYIHFSSALSSAISYAHQGAEAALEEFPGQKITFVDTLSISKGAGILVYNAFMLQQQGASDEEVIRWVEENRLRMNHWFTVDDLNHLRRGGRVSGAAAVMGTMLDLKPIITVNNEGRLVPIAKAKGRKRALKTLLDEMESRIVEPEKQVVCMLHADAPEDADYLEAEINKRFTFREFWKEYVGPVIGTHCGPGTMALLFMGDKRPC